MNIQSPTNEQARTEPSGAHGIGSAVRQTRKIRKMSNENQSNSNNNIPQPQNSEKRLDTGTALAGAFPSGFQAIATAYGDYTKKSFEDTKSFVEKMSGVKSFEKAIEIQTEFAKTAYETFVSESQKIATVYGDLAKQSYKPFGGFIAKVTPTGQ
jgi:hypothetical protein